MIHHYIESLGFMKTHYKLLDPVWLKFLLAKRGLIITRPKPYIGRRDRVCAASIASHRQSVEPTPEN
jgi:hypothetical protein